MQTDFHSSNFHDISGILFAGSSITTGSGPINIGTKSRSDNDLLDSLPYARGAEFNAYERQRDASCMPNTRVDVLADIMEWAGGRDDNGVYWLNGMAGTGKSTIARTIARRCAEQQRLGASFFFTRGGGDMASARKFVTSIARQLAASSAPLKRHICRALRGGENFANVALQDQWRRLVLEPLARGSGWHEAVVYAFRRPRPLVLVVDALDECGSDDDVALVLALLSLAEAKLVRRRLRILVTSRPETQIRHCFDTVLEADCRRLILHRIEPPVVDNDIAIFFGVNLTNISREFVCDPHWPGADNVHRLVERAGGLFIWAATACRFLFEGRQFADNRLEELLAGADTEKAPEQSLSHIYLTVLRAAARSEYRENEERELSQSLKDVLGTIAVLSAPLSGSSLATLLNLSSAGISRTLHSLHSILDIPEDPNQPIRLHHASFREFLLDHERCTDTRFWVDGATRHKALAETCLKLMCEALREDVCGLRAPGTVVSDIDRGLVEKRLSPLLQYACCYWVDHYRKADHITIKSNYIVPFLKKHFLHWLEALSLLGRLPESFSVVTTLETLKLNDDPDIRAFVHDAKRFILANMSVMEQAPLQIYSAALLFAPKSSVVREHFAHAIPAWIREQPKVQDDWSANVQTLSCGFEVKTFALSPNDQLLACATAAAHASSQATIWLWRTSTGELCGTLVGCEAAVTVLVFSPDSRLLVSGSADGAVRLWNPIIRSLRGTLLSPAGVSDAVFSSDGELLAASLLDFAVRIWSVKKRALLHELRGEHSSWIRYVGFAPDGGSIAVGSEDCPASVWDAATGTLLSTCKHDASNVTSLAVSPDVRLLACATKDCKVNVRKIADGTLLHCFPDDVTAAIGLAFSLDGRFLCSRGGSKTNIWDLQTGLSRCTIPSPNAAVLRPILSPDSKLLVLNLSDEHNMLICLWKVEGVDLVGTLSGHTDRISKVDFSHNGRLLVSASRDGTVRLWDYGPSVGRSRILEVWIEDMHFQLHGTVLVESTHYMKKIQRSTIVTDVSRGTHGHYLGGRFAGADQASGTPLLATSDGQELQIHNAHTWKSVFSFRSAPGQAASAIAASPDGLVLAVVFGGDVTISFDLATGSPRYELRGTGRAASFSADSCILATCSGDAVRLWNAQTAEASGALAGHAEAVTAVAFAPSGRTLASADRQTVRLWDCGTRRTAYILTLHEEPHLLAFSADGQRLRTAWGSVAVPAAAATATADATADALTHMYIAGGWVTWAGQRMLWLPPHFLKARQRFAVHDTTLALCSPDSTVGIAVFDFARAPVVAAANAAKAAAVGRASASARAVRAGQYRWRAAKRDSAIGRKFTVWICLLLLCFALCWSRSCSWMYTTIWALLLGVIYWASCSSGKWVRHGRVG